MAIDEIIHLLKQTIGLNPVSVGHAAIARAVELRRAARGARDLDAYLDLVQESGAELLELIEAVVVPETWFFRHPESFAAMGLAVWREWLPANPESRLRLLSVPCSTGEEPYSMAMTLISSGLPPSRFHVDAVDVSGRALSHAQRGVYGRNSFRGGELAFRERHLTETPSGWRVQADVAETVGFQGGNLLAVDFLPGRAVYDVIFCRNLLIYFDEAAQARAIKALERLLTPAGFLFVGPADAGLMIHHGFVSARLPMAFAFRKPVISAVPVPRQTESLHKSRKGPVRGKSPVKCSSSQPARAPSKIVGVDAPPAVKSMPDLDLAGYMADQGRLDEAAAICEAYLKQHRESARAFYILGVVRDAEGDSERAGACYRRALYLEPDHHDAMMHLAYSVERRGGIAAARNLRDRARRVREKSRNG